MGGKRNQLTDFLGLFVSTHTASKPFTCKSGRGLQNRLFFTYMATPPCGSLLLLCLHGDHKVKQSYAVCKISSRETCFLSLYWQTDCDMFSFLNRGETRKASKLSDSLMKARSSSTARWERNNYASGLSWHIQSIRPCVARRPDIKTGSHRHQRKIA